MNSITVNEKKLIIQQILNEETTLQKIVVFERKKKLLGEDCKIFLFNEEQSNFDTSFADKCIGKCSILGLGDYTKAWILDSKYGLEPRAIPVGKTLDFDLNILTYLNSILNERKINQSIGEDNLRCFFDFVKKNKYQCGISTAIMERITTRLDKNIFSKMLLSFIKFDLAESLDKVNDYIPPDQYVRAKNMYDYSIDKKIIHENIKQYDLVCCVIMKAILLKVDSRLNKNEKIEQLGDYCLNRLQCYMEKEIVLLSLFLMDDSSVKETFKKLNRWKNIEENIFNVAWDLFHIRLLEHMMLEDNKDGELYVLPYYATADNGIKDAMDINPIKAFVIIDGEYIVIHQKNINDIPISDKIKEEISAKFVERRNTINHVDFQAERDQLLSEILRIKTGKLGI